MRNRLGTEGLGADLLLPVRVELWLLDDGKDLVGYLRTSDGNFWLVFKLCLLFLSDVMSNWYRKNVFFTASISDGIHVEAL